MRLLIGLFLSTVLAQAEPITNNDRITCSTKSLCRVQIGAKPLPVYISFNEKKIRDLKQVHSIQFRYADGKISNTSINDMEPVLKEDPYEFREVDLNGDGLKDLALKVATGTNINHYHYWYYSKAKSRYISLGVHEEVAFNAKTKKLESVRRGLDEPEKNFEIVNDSIK